MSLDETAVLIRNPDLMAAQIDHEWVMLDESSGHYFSLNEIGGRIWNLLDKPRTMAELIAQLTQDYAVEAETCQADLQCFLAKMLQEKLVRYFTP